MNEVLSRDLDFCWEQVLSNDSWFRLHFAYAPKAHDQRLLALHALFAMLERPLLASDESVGVTQLAWWREELSQDRLVRSRHPVLGALRASGALSDLSQKHFDALLASILHLSQFPPQRTKGDLKHLCNHIGEARLVMELAVAGPGIDPTPLFQRCAGSGLARMVDLAGRRPEKLVHLLPLDLQARHLVSLRELENKAEEARAAIARFSEWGRMWLREQSSALALVAGQSGPSQDCVRHLVALTQVQQIRFERAMNGLREEGKMNLGRWRLGDPLKVWRGCRRFSKLAESSQ